MNVFEKRVLAIKKSTALFTPWGMREVRGMPTREIANLFSPRAAAFVESVRRGKIRGIRL